MFSVYACMRVFPKTASGHDLGRLVARRRDRRRGAPRGVRDHPAVAGPRAGPRRARDRLPHHRHDAVRRHVAVPFERVVSRTGSRYRTIKKKKTSSPPPSRTRVAAISTKECGSRQTLLVGLHDRTAKRSVPTKRTRWGRRRRPCGLRGRRRSRRARPRPRTRSRPSASHPRSPTPPASPPRPRPSAACSSPRAEGARREVCEGRGELGGQRLSVFQKRVGLLTT